MKTIIKIFICFSLIYTPFFVFAGAAEKWEIVENVYDKSKNSVNVTARKVAQEASNSSVYKVQVPVSASDLGKTAKSMLGAGIAVAAITALIEGVGWVIEEGSKVYKIKEKDPQDPANAPYLYYSYSNGTYIHYATSQAIVDYYQYNCKTNSFYCSSPSIGSCNGIPTGSQGMITCEATRQDGFVNNVPIEYQKNPNYNPNNPPEKVPVSDTELGDEILGNGNEPNSSPDPNSGIITDAYSPNNPVSDAPAPQSTNRALDNANPEPEAEPTGDSKPLPNKDTDGDGKPDTHDPTLPEAGTQFTLPKFCDWAPAVCEFFKVQKKDNVEIKENQKTDLAQNLTFFEKVKEWFDWTKENDDLPDDEKPQISEIPTPELKEDAIRWSAQCPSDVQVPITMQGVSSTITFSWSPWCQLLSMIKPAIIASAYIGAAFIVLGLRT